MTTEAQKEHESDYLAAFLDILDVKEQVTEVQESEAPDFRLRVDGREIGVEVTEYHAPEEVYQEGVTRRTIEARWERLQQRLTATRPADLRGLAVYLSLEDLRVPSPQEHDDFINQLYGELREHAEEIQDDGCRIVPNPMKSSVLARYVAYIDARPTIAHMDWGSNVIAGPVGVSEDDLVKAISSKLTADRPGGLDECWLLVHTGWRISQRTGWIFLEALEQYDCLNLLIDQSPYDRVSLFDVDRGRVLTWNRTEGWSVEVGDRFL